MAEFKPNQHTQQDKPGKGGPARDEIVEDLDVKQANPEEKEQVKGGKDFSFTHVIDKSSPSL